MEEIRGNQEYFGKVMKYEATLADKQGEEFQNMLHTIPLNTSNCHTDIFKRTVSTSGPKNPLHVTEFLQGQLKCPYL